MDSRCKIEAGMKPRDLYLTGAIILIITGAVASFLGHKGILLIWLAEQRNPLLDYFFYYITELGEPTGFIIVGLAMWLVSWRKMILVPILGGVVTLFSQVLKRVFDHERPARYLEHIEWGGDLQVLDYVVLGGHNSFPSGHAMGAWALFTLVALLVQKGWMSVLCLFLATTVSLSRIYLMAHFLQDVVFGAAIGTLLGWSTVMVYRRWIKKPELLP
jgi:membrane-associated phospholipid phosphatase